MKGLASPERSQFTSHGQSKLCKGELFHHFEVSLYHRLAFQTVWKSSAFERGRWRGWLKPKLKCCLPYLSRLSSNRSWWEATRNEWSRLRRHSCKRRSITYFQSEFHSSRIPFDIDIWDRLLATIHRCRYYLLAIFHCLWWLRISKIRKTHHLPTHYPCKCLLGFERTHRLSRLAPRIFQFGRHFEPWMVVIYLWY